jgi:DNA helicase-2/ATP-dependent DNA helicase PcrA
MPIIYATTPAEVEEERRLLYVGVTRARAHLHVSWSPARNPGQQARRKPSRFLLDLLPAGASPAAERAGAPGAKKSKSRGRKALVCRICQSSLATSKQRNRGYCDDCPVPYDEELFESLRNWRKEQAEAQSVPAFVVFSDATLEALAEVKPSDRRGLQSINGIGAAKLERYAEDLLAILG